MRDEPVASPAPGTLLSVADLPRDLWPEGTAKGFRVEYQGVNYRGGPRAVAGSVFVPETAPVGPTWPVLSWAHCTVGLNSSNAPSLVGLHPAERGHLTDWLRRGFVVAATDYEGLGTPEPHPYLNGEAIADDIVDIVRAVHHLGIPVDTRTVVAGFSQGGHGALYTAVMCAGYAPELDFRGTVSLAPPVRFLDFIQLRTVKGEDTVDALVPVVLAGLHVTHPGFAPERFLTATGLRLLELAASGSMRDVEEAAAGTSNDEAGLTDLTERRDVRELLAYADLPVTRYDRPVFLGAGEHDPILPAEQAASFARAMSAAGNEVTFRGYDGADHLELLVPAGADAAAWAWDLVTAAPRVVRAATGRASTRDRRFRVLDATGDGQLGRDDFEALALRLVQGFGQPPGSPLALEIRSGYRAFWTALRDHLDADRDGQVGIEEFLAAAGTLPEGFDRVVTGLASAVVALVGPDVDAGLSRTRFGALLAGCGIGGHESGELFDELDADGSGHVSVAEIVASVRDFCLGERPESPGYWLFGRV
ncbi:lipase family protein [Longispora sp. NPDC051575]|uniref:lipase family protein n=1 Tax=Longispora sp. NPDC051575 TaxID=3154943 RepID=UPI003443036D